MIAVKGFGGWMIQNSDGKILADPATGLPMVFSDCETAIRWMAA